MDTGVSVKGSNEDTIKLISDYDAIVEAVNFKFARLEQEISRREAKS